MEKTEAHTLVQSMTLPQRTAFALLRAGRQLTGAQRRALLRIRAATSVQGGELSPDPALLAVFNARARDPSSEWARTETFRRYRKQPAR
jgi:hypothetical protein